MREARQAAKARTGGQGATRDSAPGSWAFGLRTETVRCPACKCEHRRRLARLRERGVMLQLSYGIRLRALLHWYIYHLIYIAFCHAVHIHKYIYICVCSVSAYSERAHGPWCWIAVCTRMEPQATVQYDLHRRQGPEAVPVAPTCQAPVTGQPRYRCSMTMTT